MDFQQIGSKMRLETCCLCHTLRTGCLIILWFWFIGASIALLAAPFDIINHPFVYTGILLLIQGLGLYAIYKEKPMLLWPKIIEVVVVSICVIYFDFTHKSTIFVAVISIGCELYFGVLFYSLYRQMVENSTSLPV